MQFTEWLIQESSLRDLYDSAVEAFPNTRFRQHATQPIMIRSLQWTPFLGMKTLFVKALAQNENRLYEPIVLFKKVQYGEGGVHITASNGKEYTFPPLSMDKTNVLVRCNCEDFKWRFNYYDHLDRSLYGTKRAKYEAKTDRGPANPLQMPGMCKHLMKTAKVLDESGIFG